MSNEDIDVKPSPQEPVRRSYGAAVVARSRSEADEVLRKFGVSGQHAWRRIPTDKIGAAVKALDALSLNAKPLNRDAFKDTQRQAYGSGERWERVRRMADENMGNAERESAPVVRELNAEEIYKAWNAKRERPIE